jgi:Ca-activated chloride channel family protein
MVANADQSVAALAEALRLSGEAAPPRPAAARRPDAPAAAPPGFTVPKGRPGLQLSARLVKGGPAVAVPVHWIVRRAGEKGPPLWQGSAPAPLLVLPTGRYDIEARSGLVIRQAEAQAVEGEARSLDVVLDAGTVVLATSPSALAMLSESMVTFTPLETKGAGEPHILPRLESELALPPGNYLFALTAGTLRIERPVGVAAGARVSLDGSLTLGAVELSAVATKDGPPLDEVVYVVYEDDPDAPQGRREVARSAAAGPRMLLPSGSYLVIARRGAIETRDRIIVRTGETERRVLTLESGRISLAVRIGGQPPREDGPVTHRLERLDAAAPEIVRASGLATTIELAPGRYRLESRVGLGNVRVERELRVKAGATEQVAIEHSAGRVVLRALEKAGGQPLVDVGWELRDRAGKVVWTGIGTEARAVLLAGRYTVKVEGRGVASERQVEIREGQALTYDLLVR